MFPELGVSAAGDGAEVRRSPFAALGSTSVDFFSAFLEIFYEEKDFAVRVDGRRMRSLRSSSDALSSAGKQLRQ
ncbi:hypothetical protein Q5P01_023453 [Channa striata]|uniref:Uncharacterized protein n=1 Tax=Channa striata TaxID=64152 RepID=A0AA88IUD8_CHASR|nr:hypothetical protein Q5P01_023453 [Channa striata]